MKIKIQHIKICGTESSTEKKNFNTKCIHQKKEKFSYNPSSHLKILEKKERNKPKPSRRKGIIKATIEIDDTEKKNIFKTSEKNQ